MPAVLLYDDVECFKSMVLGGFVAFDAGTFVDACYFGASHRIVEWIIGEMRRRKTPLTVSEMASGYEASYEYSDQYPDEVTY